MATSPDGGAAQPMQETSDAPGGGPVIPAYVVDDDRTVIGDAPQPVYLVSDTELADGTYHLEGRPLALPVVFDDTRGAKGGKPQAIYVVNGNQPIFTSVFTPDADPLVSSTTVHVLDTRDVLLSNEGAIRDQEPGTVGIPTAYAYGQVGVYLTQADGSGWERVPGRVFAFRFMPQDRNAGLTVGISDTPSNGDKRANSLVLIHQDGKLIIGNGTQQVEVDPGKSNIRPLPYWAFFVLGDTHTEIWLATIDDDTGGGMTDPIGILGTPQARRVYVDFTQTTSPLYPVWQLSGTLAYPLGSALEQVIIQDQTDAPLLQDGGDAVFFDRVNRANSANNPGAAYTVHSGSFGIANNAIVVQSAGVLSTEAAADGYFVWEFNFSGGVAFSAPVVRMVNSQNYLRFYTNGGNQYQLQIIENGGYVGVVAGISGPVTWNTNGRNRVEAYLHGNRMLWIINGVRVTGGWVTDSANWFLNGTRMGVQDLNGAGLKAAWKILTCYDHGVILPTDLQRYTTFRKGTRGAQVFQDTFTAANGTTLASRGWTVHSGTATIQNNAALLQDPTVAYATIDAGATTFEAVATIQLPPATIVFTFIGFVIYLNAQNYAYYRLAIDKVGQPDADEIERGRMLAGVDHVTGKVQMDGTEYLAGLVKSVSVRKWPDGWVHVYLGGKIRLADRLPVALRGAARIGIIRYAQDTDTSGNPSTVLDVTVYGLT